MKIAIAPHMPILAKGKPGDPVFDSLCLASLPSYTSIVVPEGWYEFLADAEGITSSYELFSLLLKLPVIESPISPKSTYVKLNPNILDKCDDESTKTAKGQIYSLTQLGDCRKLYAGTDHPAQTFVVSLNRHDTAMTHFRPAKGCTLTHLIQSFEPTLIQLKHYQDARKAGDKDISPFSAYDKRDEKYAMQLLKQAYEEHAGDIDDDTYLYTYDAKYHTFVQFRPNRGNRYHGMDITSAHARKVAPEIVRLYNK